MRGGWSGSRVLGSRSEVYEDVSPAEDFVVEDMWDASKIPDEKLRRVNPKRFNIQEDWYHGNVEHGHDSDIANRYDSTEPVISALNIAIQKLDRQIISAQEHLSKSSSLEIYDDYFNTLQLRAQAYRGLQIISGLWFECGTSYNKFPWIIKSFITQRYAEVFTRDKGLLNYLNSFILKEVPLSSNLIGNIRASVDPDGRVIYCYVERSSDLFYIGVVHELVHAIQHYLQGRAVDVSVPPNINFEYYKFNKTYKADCAEQEANRVIDEFTTFKQRYQEILDYADIQQNMFNKRVLEVGDKELNIFWENDAFQRSRFEALAGVADLNKTSVLDVGCGYGDFYGFLYGEGVELKDYLGIDISGKACKEARRRYKTARFLQANIYELEIEKKYDYAVASGIFTLFSPAWKEVIYKTVQAMLQHVTKGLAVNFLQGDISGTRDGVYLYLNKQDVIKLLFDLVARIEYVHEYLPGDTDFTLYLLK